MEAEHQVLDSVNSLLNSIRIERLTNGHGSKRLADYCVENGIQIGPFGSQLHASDYVREGIPVVMPTDMSDDEIVEEGIGKISGSKANSLSAHRVRIGDILLPRRGELDRRVLIRPEQEGWLCGTGSLRVRIDPKYSPRAIFHALASPLTVRWLRDNAVGTTMPNLNSSIVAQIPVNLPQKELLDQVMNLLDMIDNVRSRTKGHLENTKKLKCLLINKFLEK